MPTQTLQKVVITIITNSSRLELSRPLFKHSNILPFRKFGVYKVLTVFYRRSGNSHSNINPYNLSLRTKKSFSIPKLNLSILIKYFSYIALFLFNKSAQRIIFKCGVSHHRCFTNQGRWIQRVNRPLGLHRRGLWIQVGRCSRDIT